MSGERRGSSFLEPDFLIGATVTTTAALLIAIAAGDNIRDRVFQLTHLLDKPTRTITTPTPVATSTPRIIADIPASIAADLVTVVRGGVRPLHQGFFAEDSSSSLAGGLTTRLISSGRRTGLDDRPSFLSRREAIRTPIYGWDLSREVGRDGFSHLSALVVYSPTGRLDRAELLGSLNLVDLSLENLPDTLNTALNIPESSEWRPREYLAEVVGTGPGFHIRGTREDGTLVDVHAITSGSFRYLATQPDR